MDRSLGDLRLTTRWVGRPLEYVEEIDSTNLRAEQRAREGAAEGTVVLADRQSAGRGRLGRSFFSPGGVSLYLSLVLRPQLPPERLHEHVFAAAVAVADLAAQHVDPARVAIKWPNDVLIDGRKLSGINAPAQISGGRAEFLVLGVGVNVNTESAAFPAELRTTATSLRIASGAPVERAAAAQALLANLERELDRHRAQGFGSVLDRWRIYFRMRGSRVRISAPGPGPSPAQTSSAETGTEPGTAAARTVGWNPGVAARGIAPGLPPGRAAGRSGMNPRPEMLHDGIAEDVDGDGALILRVQRGGASTRQRIVAGDVALVDAASALSTSGDPPQES